MLTNDELLQKHYHYRNGGVDFNEDPCNDDCRITLLCKLMTASIDHQLQCIEEWEEPEAPATTEPPEESGARTLPQNMAMIFAAVLFVLF